MRVMFCSRPAFGHVFPLVPLALAARDAGHDVSFATGESFHERLRNVGFEVHPSGEGPEWGFPRAAERFPEFLDPETRDFGGAFFVDVLGIRTLEDMPTVIETHRPDIMVYESTDVGAAVVGAAAGIPVVSHSLSVWDDGFREAIRKRTHILWDAVGAPEAVDVTVGDAFIDIWPPSMQAPGARAATSRHWSIKTIPWGDPATSIPAWVREVEGPLIFVSLGTVFWGKDLLTKVIDALARIDCDALVLAGIDAAPEDFPNIGPRTRVEGFVDQPGVLKHASVVVDHGGAGTMLGALANGLPQLVLPEGADRPTTAASLRTSGAGIVLHPRESSVEDIELAVRRLLDDPSYRTRAEEIRSEMDALPEPAEVVKQLESLGGRGWIRTKS